MRLTILVLHRMGDPARWRKAVRDLEYLLPDHEPDHDYIVHAAEQPLPAFVKDLKFHAIILGPTFLCARYTPHGFREVQQEYGFIRDSDAFKIALPQDDYDCSAVLDQWMIDWRIDTVYAAVADHWPVLYPKFHATGRLQQGYTGYIPDRWLQRFSNPKPHADRAIDVSYRASPLPPNYGRIGLTKREIGTRFAAHPATRGLRLDISTDPADLVAGDRWHDFLENSRFCLAANSGSSLLDPVGEIRQCVERQLIRDEAATFDQIEAACFPGQDGRLSFTAISPRNLEAALARTVQIATPGPYSGVLRAHDHYLPLATDCSNAAEVVEAMRDSALVERLATDARDAVLGVSALRAANHARSLIAQIEAGSSAKRISSTPGAAAAAVARYHEEVTGGADAFWARDRRRQRVRNVLVALGARKIKRWLMGNN